MNSENLLKRIDDRGIYYLTINRPHVMNAFDENLIKDLNEVFLEHIYCIILLGLF